MDNLSQLCAVREWDPAVARRLGLRDVGRRVRFPSRLLGEPEAWWCDRALDGESPKWRNAAGREVIPPGLHEAIGPGVELVVCVEGLSDWVAISHVPGVVAVGIPGAMTFRWDWARLLAYKVVVVVVDNDQAGSVLADRVTDLLPGAQVVRPPAWHKDVDDWRRSVGADAFAAEVATVLASAPTVGGNGRAPRSWMLRGAG